MLKRLLVAAAFGTVTVAAGAQDQGGQPDWIEQARILAQMEGTSVGEQVRRYRLQQQADRLDDRFNSDPDYAGMQIDRKGPNFKIAFAFKGVGKQRSVDDPELAGVSTFVPAAYSKAEIQQERQRLFSVLRENKLSAAFAVRFQELQLFPDDPARVKALIESGTIVLAPFVKLREGPAKRVDEANIDGAGLMTGYGPRQDSCRTIGVSVGSLLQQLQLQRWTVLRLLATVTQTPATYGRIEEWRSAPARGINIA